MLVESFWETSQCCPLNEAIGPLSTDNCMLFWKKGPSRGPLYANGALEYIYNSQKASHAVLPGKWVRNTLYMPVWSIFPVILRTETVYWSELIKRCTWNTLCLGSEHITYPYIRQKSPKQHYLITHSNRALRCVKLLVPKMGYQVSSSILCASAALIQENCLHWGWRHQ